MSESRIETVQRRLTETEIVVLAEEAARVHGEILQLEGELKEAREHFKARITAKWERVKKLNEQIRNGYVDESVPVDIYYNLPTRGMKTIWDHANLRVVKIEAMTATDRQRDMFDLRETPQELLDELNRDQPPTEEAG